MMPVVHIDAVTSKQHFVKEAISASWLDYEDEFDFQNFVTVAAAECVGSRFIYRPAFLDSSAECRQNSYAECCISLAE